MWGYDNAYLILLQRMLPNLLYTLVLTPLWFLLVRRLHRFFQEKLEEGAHRTKRMWER